MPWSLGAIVTRKQRIGSSTSIEIGPARVSVRSVGASREPRTTDWCPPRTTETAASITRRFGYRPSATPKNRSASRVKPLNQ